MITGKQIRAARLERGLKQEELAKIAGIPRTRISLIENGKSRGSVKVLTALEKVLDISNSKAGADQDAPALSRKSVELSAIRMSTQLQALSLFFRDPDVPLEVKYEELRNFCKATLEVMEES